MTVVQDIESKKTNKYNRPIRPIIISDCAGEALAEGDFFITEKEAGRC